MAKIDFNTSNIGIKIHDDGEYEIPEHIISDPALSVPDRFGLNADETPHIVFDRFPGLTDTQVETELDKIWNEQEWPELCAEFASAIAGIKNEAATRLEHSKWRLDKALEQAGGDWSDAKVVKILADREDVRVKSNAQEELLKAAFIARKPTFLWPSQHAWTSAIMDTSEGSAKDYESGYVGTGVPTAYSANHVKQVYGIDNPGRTDS